MDCTSAGKTRAPEQGGNLERLEARCNRLQNRAVGHITPPSGVGAAGATPDVSLGHEGPELSAVVRVGRREEDAVPDRDEAARL